MVADRPDHTARPRQRRPGIVWIHEGRPFSVGAFTVENGKIVELDFLADPERIARLDLTVLGE